MARLQRNGYRGRHQRRHRNANVKALAYVDACIPDQGQTLLELDIAEASSWVAGDPVLCAASPTTHS